MSRWKSVRRIVYLISELLVGFYFYISWTLPVCLILTMCSSGKMNNTWPIVYLLISFVMSLKTICVLGSEGWTLYGDSVVRQQSQAIYPQQTPFRFSRQQPIKRENNKEIYQVGEGRQMHQHSWTVATGVEGRSINHGTQGAINRLASLDQRETQFTGRGRKWMKKQLLEPEKTNEQLLEGERTHTHLLEAERTNKQLSEDKRANPQLPQLTRSPRLFSNPFGLLGHRSCRTNTDNFRNASGICYNEVECLIKGGRFSEYCGPPSLTGVCCVFVNSNCEQTRTAWQRVSYFTNPSWPGTDSAPTTCQLRVKALKDTCWVSSINSSPAISHFWQLQKNH